MWLRCRTLPAASSPCFLASSSLLLGFFSFLAFSFQLLPLSLCFLLCPVVCFRFGPYSPFAFAFDGFVPSAKYFLTLLFGVVFLVHPLDAFLVSFAVFY